MKQEYGTESPAETQALAMRIAQHLRGGEVIELASDLGGGKTTFTHGLVRALGSPDKVASPTFTISREYRGGRLHVFHFDFYRLGEAGIIADELAEIVGDPSAVVVVEWADVVAQALPEHRLRIHIQATGEHNRTLTITYPEALSYLMEDV